MRRIGYYIAPLFFIFILIRSFVSPAFAGDTEALEYYKKGEDYFQKEKYEESLKWYKKAVEERSSDGTITIREEVTETVPYGRTFKKITNYNNRYEDYKPNARIAEIMQKTLPSDLTATVKFMEGASHLQNKSIDPDEESFLIVTVTNNGKGHAFDVRMDVENDNRYVEHQRTFSLSDIGAGESKETRIKLKAGQKLTTGTASFKVACSEKRGYECKEAKLLVPTAALEPPDLVVKFLRFNDGRHKRGVGNGDGRLGAGERGELVVQVENQGKGAAFGVNPVISTSEKGVTLGAPDPEEIEMIDPGERKEIHIPVDGGLDLAGGDARILIEARERRGFDARKVKVAFETVKLARPDFIIKSVRVLDGTAGQAQGNGNGILENGETAELQVFVTNKGEGEAFGVRITLTDITPAGVEIVQRESEVGQIGVGETVKGKVVVRVPRHVSLNKVDARFRVEEVERKAAKTDQAISLNGGALKPDLAIKVDWSDDNRGQARGNGNGIWETGETIEGVITVTNYGNLPAEGVDVKLRIKDEDLRATPGKFTVGRLEPKQSSLPLRTILTIPRTYEGQKVDIEAIAEQRDFPEVRESSIQTVRLLKPVLVVTERIANQSLSGEKGVIGSVIQGERTRLEFRVRNDGTLNAEGVTVRVISRRPEVQLTGETVFPLGTVPAGQSSELLIVPLLIARGVPLGPSKVVVDVTQDEFQGVKQTGVLLVQEEGAEEIKVAGETLKTYRPTTPSPAVMNPVVIVTSPPPGGIVQDSFDLAWDVSREVLSVEVRVNGEVLPKQAGRGIALTDKAGEGKPNRFHEKVPLKPGLNTIEVAAYDLSNERWVDKIEVTRIAEHGEIWAVVIGVSSYQNVPALKYARRDAEAFYEYLTEYIGVPPDHIQTLYDADVTDRKMRHILGKWLKEKASRNDTVYIYFAGHGAPENDPQSEDKDGFEKYLLTVDADPSDLHSTAVSMKYVAEVFGRLNSDRVVFIVDSCFSGASAGRTILAANSTRGAILSEDFLERLSKGKGRVILSASRANEVSMEDSIYGGGHGVFTYYLLEGLKGAADYSQDGDIDVDELRQYLTKMVPQATGQRQTPVMKGEVEGKLTIGKVK